MAVAEQAAVVAEYVEVSELQMFLINQTSASSGGQVLNQVIGSGTLACHVALSCCPCHVAVHWRPQLASLADHWCCRR